MTISADCSVQDGASAPVSPYSGGVDVTPANTITIQLLSSGGAEQWDLFVAGTDELIAAPTLTINYTTKTATFTAPAAGSAIILTSRVTSRNGVDPVTGQSPYIVSRNIGVYTLISAKRVGALGETFEGDPVYGYIKKINALIRLSAGGSTPTGTGIPHIVGGVQNAAASLIVNADVSGSAAIDGSKLNANLVVTTSLAIGTTTAAAGAIRLASAATTPLAVRNAANSADIAVIANNANAITFGDATNGTTSTFTSGAGNCTLQTGAGTFVQLAYASGNVIVSTTGMQLSNAPASGTGVFVNAPWNGAASLIFGAAVTSATVNVNDNTTNSATGIVLKLQGQNATGTTTTGGELQLGPGTGTTANGKLNLINIITGTTVGAAGAGSALPATPAGYMNIKINGTAQRIPYYA